MSIPSSIQRNIEDRWADFETALEERDFEKAESIKGFTEEMYGTVIGQLMEVELRNAKQEDLAEHDDF